MRKKIRNKVGSGFRGNDNVFAGRTIRWALLVGVIWMIAGLSSCEVLFAQVDLYQYNMGEIMNAWNQRVDTLLFNDTLAAGDTVESAPIGLIGVYTGQPQYYCAGITVDTLAGYPSPGFLAEFRIKIRGRWYLNYDGTEKFMSYFDIPDYPWSLIFPLAIYGGDSIKYIYTTTDSCVVGQVHWQIH